MSYLSEDFQSIADFMKIQEGGLSALGFLCVLKDILGGRQGTVDLEALASSLGITMQKLYGFIGILEDSFLIKTAATPKGRHIELTGQAQQEFLLSSEVHAQ